MQSWRRIILTLLLLACGPRVRADLVDSIQAVVSEVPVTQQHVDRFIAPDEEFIFQRYRGQPQAYRTNLLALRNNGFELLIERELILHDFKDAVKIPESILDEIVQDEVHKLGDRVQLTKDLENQGRTFEDLRKQIRDRIVVEEMLRKFVPEPIISPRKIEAFYTSHLEIFKMADQIKMRMIFLNKGADDPSHVRQRAGEILSQIQGGASFEQMAKIYSEGSLRSEGGETGWEDLSVVNKILAPELEKLKPGQFTGVIEAPEGYYLLLLEDRHPAHYKPLNEVRETIDKNLASIERERLRRQWIQRLKNKTFVRYF